MALGVLGSAVGVGVRLSFSWVGVGPSGRAPTQKRKRPGPTPKGRMGRPGNQPKGEEGEGPGPILKGRARPDPRAKEA